MPGPPVIYRLSGKYWVDWQRRYHPNSDRIDDLESGFQRAVKDFKRALEQNQTKVKVTIKVKHTRRSQQAAYLFHWTYKVAKGLAAPKDAGREIGVHIQWDHGNRGASVAAAQEMFSGFGLSLGNKKIPPLKSLHIPGKAIDWVISWSGTIWVQKKNGALVKIQSGPVNTNTALHEVGASYGVYKLKDDPEHWSFDGH